MQSIFISYSRKDAIEIAEILSNRLRVLKYDVFRDKDNLVGSQKWKDELINNIFRCDLMVVLVSELSNDSDYVYKEISIAEKYNKPILPIRINNTKLPVYLRQTQAIEFTNNNYGDLLLEIKLVLDGIPDRELNKKTSISKSKVRQFPISSRGIILLSLFIVIIATTYLILNQNNFANIAGAPSNTPIRPPPTTTKTSLSPPQSITPTASKSSTRIATQIFLPPTPAQILGQLLLAVNFEDARMPPDWAEKAGKWTIVTVDSNAALQPVGNSEIEICDERWIDYSFETDIMVTDLSKANRMWVDIRNLSNLDRRIVLVLDFHSNTLILISINGHDTEELTRIKFVFPEDTWFTLRYEAQKDLIFVYINDVLGIYKRIDSVFAYGGIRLRTTNDYVLFDNMRVTSLESNQN